MMDDPPRLGEDPAASDVARALREARSDVLSPEAVARVHAGLIAAGIALPHAVSGGQLPATRSPMAKLFMAAARVGLACLGLASLGLVGMLGVQQIRAHPAA